LYEGLLSRREQQSRIQVPAIAKENAPTPKDERVFFGGMRG
jgi:hypothetical protein